MPGECGANDPSLPIASGSSAPMAERQIRSLAADLQQQVSHENQARLKTELSGMRLNPLMTRA
jgi:hypothetical protein